VTCSCEKRNNLHVVIHSTQTISLTLIDLQLDTKNSYLFTYNTFIKILYMFRALLCSSSGGLRRNCIYAASGIVTIPEAAYIQLRHRPPEDEQGNARNM
jgi:hypothetical protein